MAAGRLVVHKETGKRGRTYNDKTVVDGKIAVYYETEKDSFIFADKASLVEASKVSVIGFID